ncbi:hypothetical protein H8A97_03790 [Bradyrhizobium sp. Arg62]|uniref:hypothetical protein n=1 Tax=Bradyrhizobium brasilense TaxID=1419277 RepID=UPI001E451E7D|nr:hypothetical protein [Bradyrhizobium brasilense]MCC8944246.1 hypothetical protein [Bradyrhizobium brasilense]
MLVLDMLPAVFDGRCPARSGDAMTLVQKPLLPLFNGCLPPGSRRTAVNALGLTDATLKTVDLELAGDTAYEIGEADLKLSSGQAKVKYLVVWTRDRDGQLRLHRDIWNNLPTS